MRALHEAVWICGGTKASLAKKMGVSAMSVSGWFARRVPAARAVQIEELTGGQVTRHDLRPDLYERTPVPGYSGKDRRK